jgi:hypothetical protein
MKLITISSVVQRSFSSAKAPNRSSAPMTSWFGPILQASTVLTLRCAEAPMAVQTLPTPKPWA